jgi:hypothetical protein
LVFPRPGADYIAPGKKCVYDGIYNMVMRAYAQSSGRFTPVILYAILSAISCPL